jgi:serine/threonine protein kinase
MLYEMTTGKAPFEGPNAYAVMNSRLLGDPIAPRKVNEKISPEVEEIILHALQRKPDDRYTCAAEMKQELDNPEKVKVTGLADSLAQPVQVSEHAGSTKILFWALVVPVLVIILFFIFFRPK